MKFALINLLLVAAVTAASGNSVAIAPPSNGTNLALQLNDLQRLVPWKPLRQLIVRYLLNDAEFQAVIRAINTPEACVLRLRLLAQPEIIQLRNFIRQNLQLSGVSVEVDDIELSLINKSPYWGQSVFGWQGFIDEFSWIYPADYIRAQIAANASQVGAFAELWRRVQAVQAAYERVLATPQAQRVVAQLETLGVDTASVDQFVRQQLGWRNATVSVAAAPTQGAAGAPLVL